MEKGKVIKIINKTKALISIENPGDCESCSGKSSCSLFNKKNNLIEARYDDKMEIDDIVNVIIKPGNRIILSFLIFLLPILALLIFYFIGLYLFKKENIASLVSFSGFLVSFFFIIALIRFSKSKDRFVPYITKEKD